MKLLFENFRKFLEEETVPYSDWERQKTGYDEPGMTHPQSDPDVEDPEVPIEKKTLRYMQPPSTPETTFDTKGFKVWAKATGRFAKACGGQCSDIELEGFWGRILNNEDFQDKFKNAVKIELRNVGVAPPDEIYVTK